MARPPTAASTEPPRSPALTVNAQSGPGTMISRMATTQNAATELAVTELAAQVGLSISPCHRRLRELERSGAIRGYRAVVDADALGLSFEALVFITMRQEDRETLIGFETGVAAIPQVVQAQRLFGDPDYLLRIVTTDLAAYQRLQDERLSALPGVQRMTSTLVMKRIVQDRPLPG